MHVCAHCDCDYVLLYYFDLVIRSAGSQNFDWACVSGVARGNMYIFMCFSLIYSQWHRDSYTCFLAVLFFLFFLPHFSSVIAIHSLILTRNSVESILARVSANLAFHCVSARTHSNQISMNILAFSSKSFDLHGNSSTDWLLTLWTFFFSFRNNSQIACQCRNSFHLIFFFSFQF